MFKCFWTFLEFFYNLHNLISYNYNNNKLFCNFLKNDTNYLLLHKNDYVFKTCLRKKLYITVILPNECFKLHDYSD